MQNSQKSRYLVALGACCLLSIQCAKADSVKDFNINATITKEGLLKVEETIRVDFTEANKHGLLRKIPLDFASNKAELKIESVQCPPGIEAEYQETESNRSRQLKIGNKFKTVSGTKVYFIKYTVADIFDKSGKTSWSPNGKYWHLPIENLHLQMQIEDNAASANAVALLKSTPLKPTKTYARLNFTSTKLMPGQAATMSLMGKPAGLGSRQKRQAFGLEKTDPIFALSFLGLCGIFLFAALKNMHRPRDLSQPRPDSSGRDYYYYTHPNSHFDTDSFDNYNSSSGWSSSSDSSSSDSGSSGGGDSW